jgi:hypothetical protein
MPERDTTPLRSLMGALLFMIFSAAFHGHALAQGSKPQPDEHPLYVLFYDGADPQKPIGPIILPQSGNAITLVLESAEGVIWNLVGDGATLDTVHLRGKGGMASSVELNGSPLTATMQHNTEPVPGFGAEREEAYAKAYGATWPNGFFHFNLPTQSVEVVNLRAPNGGQIPKYATKQGVPVADLPTLFQDSFADLEGTRLMVGRQTLHLPNTWIVDTDAGQAVLTQEHPRTHNPKRVLMASAYDLPARITRNVVATSDATRFYGLDFSSVSASSTVWLYKAEERLWSTVEIPSSQMKGLFFPKGQDTPVVVLETETGFEIVPLTADHTLATEETIAFSLYGIPYGFALAGPNAPFFHVMAMDDAHVLLRAERQLGNGPMTSLETLKRLPHYHAIFYLLDRTTGVARTVDTAALTAGEE